MGLFSSVLIMMLEKFYVRVWGQSSQHCMPRSFFSQLLESPLQGHFPKSIAQKWNWPRKGGAFERQGQSSRLAWHRLWLPLWPGRRLLPDALGRGSIPGLAFCVHFAHITPPFFHKEGNQDCCFSSLALKEGFIVPVRALWMPLGSDRGW